MIIKKEFKAGLIVLGTCLAFWYMFQFLKGKNLFSSENIYYVNFADVSGLEKTKPITINGLKVGRVESIEPVISGNSELSFKVGLLIKKEFPIYKNSIAEIHEPGLMSGKEIRIIYPKNKILAQSGEFINGHLKSSLTAMLGNEVGPIKDNLNKVLTDLDKTLLTTDQTIGSAKDIFDAENKQNLKLLIINLNKTITEFQKTSYQINQILGTNQQKVGELVNNANGMVSNADKMMSSANETLKKYGNVADKLNQVQLDETIKKLDNNLVNLNASLEKLNQGKGTAGKVLNDEQLYDNLTSATKSLDELLKDFKASPKRYIHFSVFGRKDKPQETQIINQENNKN